MNGMSVKGKNITHMRGDTAILNLDLKVDNEPFALGEGDIAVFSVKKNLKDTDYLLQKTAVDGKFVFQHEDTQGLPFGSYWYDIQVQLEGGQVITAVGPAQYRLVPDVTGR